MKSTKLELKPLVAAIFAALSVYPWQAQAQAQAQTVPADQPGQAVLITGSRIPRASLEGPSAVTVITGAEITRQGYKNVFDALSNQVQNSGFTQGADFGNTFTPSANAISLRGLGPNHTLILLNGRRLADFPSAYDGAVNFTNLANIPSSVVERIEILNGGASAVYGSDAIAGVINIILKKQAEGVDVNLKVGDTTRGGGGDKRVQVTGGGSFGKLNTLFSLELSERSPLWASQRDFMDSKSGLPTSVLGRKDIVSGNYLDPGDACANLGDAFDNSVIQYSAKKGSYCASPRAGATYWTTQTKNQSQNFFGSANYELSAETSFFSDVLIGQNSTENNTRGPSWTSSSTNNGYFWNRNSGAYEAWNKYISPEEIGGKSRYNRSWDDLAVAVSLGVKGRLPGTEWNYEAAYNASVYRSKSHTPRALSNIDSFFLGPKLGVDGDGIAIYAPDPGRLNQRLTPAEFDGITGASNGENRSWTNTLSLVANGDAFQLPAGAAKVATVVEAARQGFREQSDPLINQGAFNTVSKTADAAGTRDRYALGAELSLPLLKEVSATLAGRYDRYNFADRSDGKFTYNAGLEIRPAKALLVRGNYATSFRAPDMNYIYKARDTGYFASTTDNYRCELAGQALENCDYANVSPGADYVQIGSKDLKSEQGKSFGAGVVWSPSANFDVSLDYWNIKIDGLITNLDPDQLLRDEAACRMHRLDINSASCVDTLSRITRYPVNALNKPNEIKEIRVNPINAASESSGGIDLSLRYRLPTAAYGDFVWKANYAKVLSKKSRQFAADALKDELHSLDNSDWPDKLNVSLSWSRGAWNNTLFATRYGKIPNQAQTAYLTPTTIANFSAVYQIDSRTTLSLIVNNLMNTIKSDSSGGWPNYPVGSYSPVGRQGWLELNYHFGS
ncbi:iron complex outermembrane receptor protein [Oxalobacteraceae bacterium GrIS 1.11]